VGKVVAVELPCAQRQPHRAEQGRVRVRLEGGLDQVRQLAAATVELEEVGALDLAEVGPAAALADPQQTAVSGHRGPVRWKYRSSGSSLPTGGRILVSLANFLVWQSRSRLG
jgi:hypothetical protein